MADFFKNWGLFWLVAICGFVGAAISYAVGASSAIEIVEPWRNSAVQTLFQIGIGGFCSVVFVFLLSNTERGDVFRLVCVALVAGFLWPTVLDTIKKYQIVKQQSERGSSALEARVDALLAPPGGAPQGGSAGLEYFLEEYNRTRPMIFGSDGTKVDQSLAELLKARPQLQLALPPSTIQGLGDLSTIISPNARDGLNAVVPNIPWQ